jgi:hypothetical protein
MQATREELAANAIAKGLYVLAKSQFCLGAASAEEIMRAEMDILMNIFLKLDSLVPGNVRLPPRR